MTTQPFVERLLILDELRRCDPHDYFHSPIDESLPLYRTIIKQPMCINTVANHRGLSDADFFRCLKLVYRNAIRFNPVSTDVHRCARRCLDWLCEEEVKFFERREDTINRQFLREKRQKRKEEEIEREKMKEARERLRQDREMGIHGLNPLDRTRLFRRLGNCTPQELADVQAVLARHGKQDLLVIGKEELEFALHRCPAPIAKEIRKVLQLIPPGGT